MGSSCPPRPCVRASSVLLDVERAPGSLPVRVFPPLAGPSHRETRVHSAVERTPFRVLRPPYSTVRPLGRSRPPLRFPCPSTASSRQPLYGAGCSIPAPVPLSGFLNLSAVSASSSSTALFRAATVPGLLPSEPSPHRDRVPLPGPPLLPCGHPPTCWTARFRSLVTTGFPDARAFDAVAWFPRRLWAPFPRIETRFPVALGSGRLPPVPPASPASELSSPCESVRAFPGFPRLDGRCSPGLLPLQSSLPDLGASDPPQGQHPRFG
jgi:hypothetical protein